MKSTAIALATIGILYLAVGSAGGTVARGTALSKPKPASPATLAKQLAVRVSAAKTPSARYSAVLAVMRALDIGVYSTRGKALVSGLERGPRDFYLYDFEVRGIAAALDRKDVFGLDGIARLLNTFLQRARAIGLTGGSAGMPEQLRQGLVAVTRSSLRAPGKAASLVPLLVRELGLRKSAPYDLASDTPLERIQLDALQQSLLAYEVTEAVLAKTPAKARGGSKGGRALARSAAPCDFDGVKKVGKWGKWVLSLAPWRVGKIAGQSVKIGDWIKLINILTDLAHGATLGVVVDFQAARGDQVWSTHYGPLDHAENAGKDMVFQVGLQMLVTLPEAVKCGKLLGLEFPHKGPIEGVPIHWDTLIGDYGRLKKHGTIKREDKKTNSSGLAVLILTPKTEKIPGWPALAHVKSGNLSVTADVLSTFGNITGSIWEMIDSFNPRMIQFPWEVTFHKARGLKFSGVAFSEACPPGSCNPNCPPCTDTTTYSAHVCGDDPSGQLWDIHGSSVDNWPNPTPEFDILTSLDTFPGPAAKWVQPSAPGEPPKITFTANIGDPWYAIGPTTVTVDVEEYTDCPDNSEE
jgi:hypothetical protein